MTLITLTPPIILLLFITSATLSQMIIRQHKHEIIISIRLIENEMKKYDGSGKEKWNWKEGLP